jgi:hypothetical protein
MAYGHKQSDLEAQMLFQIRAAGLPIPEEEFQFHPERKWRFDMAWPERKIALEVEGGVFSKGRHTRPSGFIGDCEKYNEAALLGWRVFRMPGPWIGSGEALSMIEKAFNGGS